MGRAAAGVRWTGCLLLMINAAHLYPQASSPRTVAVKVVADEKFRESDTWLEETRSTIKNSFFHFDKRFGIRFKIKKIHYWKPNGAGKPLPYFLDELRGTIGKDDSDLVIGIISPHRLANGAAAISHFFDGYILAAGLRQQPTLEFLLTHEICHIFGAIDLNESDSVMASRDPVEKFDPFTERIIRLHRDRTFRFHTFPLSRDRLDDAILAFGQRTELRLGEPEAHMRLAVLYGEKKDYDSALAACSELQRLSPGLKAVHTMMGNLYLSQNRNEKAIDEYLIALTSNPGSADIQCNLGIAYARKGQLQDAEARYKSALKLDPNSIKAHANLANLYLGLGNTEQAILECRAALAVSPEVAEALCTLGAALIRKNLAIVVSSNGAEAGVWDPDLNDITEIRRAKAEMQEAVETCQKATVLKPDLPDAHNILAIGYAHQERFDEAEQEFIRALEINPGYLQAHYNLGLFYFSRGASEKAALHLKKIIEINPSSAVARRVLAQVFRNQESYSVITENTEK